MPQQINVPEVTPMFYCDKRLQYPVKVSKPDPIFARMLQQAIGGVMLQQQWLAVVEELGGTAALPIPTSFPQSEEHQKFSYNFLATQHDGTAPEKGRWPRGPSIDGKGKFTVFQNKPMGEEPILGPARPTAGPRPSICRTKCLLKGGHFLIAHKQYCPSLR